MIDKKTTQEKLFFIKNICEYIKINVEDIKKETPSFKTILQVASFNIDFLIKIDKAIKSDDLGYEREMFAKNFLVEYLRLINKISSILLKKQQDELFYSDVLTNERYIKNIIFNFQKQYFKLDEYIKKSVKINSNDTQLSLLTFLLKQITIITTYYSTYIPDFKYYNKPTTIETYQILDKFEIEKNNNEKKHHPFKNPETIEFFDYIVKHWTDYKANAKWAYIWNYLFDNGDLTYKTEYIKFLIEKGLLTKTKLDYDKATSQKHKNRLIELHEEFRKISN